MAKKRMKKGKGTVRKPAGSISKKLDRVLEGQKKILMEEAKIEIAEKATEEKEEEIEALEQKPISGIENLEKIEREIEQQVTQHPLAQVTIKDLYKGSIGAFIGTTLHYTMYYGVKIAEELTMSRATIIYILSFMMGMVFLYITGFKNVKDSKALAYLPARMVVLYTLSIIISIAVLFLFFPSFGHSFEDAYKQIATVSLIAVIGACTADMLWRD